MKPKSASSRNVLKLAGGTAGSQVITVAAAPILTRLYGPESFGVLATFASILALLNVVSSLRYELAIVLPKDDAEAVALVRLCFVLVAISTGITALGVLLLSDQLVIWLNEPAIKPLLWLLPIGVLFSGLYQPLSYWAIRRKQYGLLAQTKFCQSIFGVATNLAAAPLGTIGLLLGQIVSQSAGFVAIIRNSNRDIIVLKQINPMKLLTTLKSYSDFGIYSSPAGLVNVAANQVPIILFAALFDTSSLGKLSLSMRILLIPLGLLSATIGKVFLQRVSGVNEKKFVYDIFISVSRRLMFLVVPAVLFLVLGFYLFSDLILGKQWQGLGLISFLLVPMLILKSIVGSVGQVLFAIGSAKLQFKAQLAFLVITLFPFFLYPYLNSPPFWLAILAWSLFSSLGYLMFWLVCFFATKKLSATTL